MKDVIAHIPSDVWYNNIFYYTSPSDIYRLQLTCCFFNTLLDTDNNTSTHLNEMWKFQYNLFMENRSEKSTQLKLSEVLEQPSLKELYSFGETSYLHYRKVFRDIVETIKLYPSCFNEVYLNMKVMKDILNTKWTCSGQHVKCVFLGDSHARTTEVLITAIPKEFPRDYIPTVFDNVWFWFCDYIVFTYTFCCHNSMILQ
jgi:hypothetical protein